MNWWWRLPIVYMCSSVCRHLSKCLYVCVHLCVDVLMCVYTSGYTCVCVHVFLCSCVYVCVHPGVLDEGRKFWLKFLAGPIT